MVAPLAAAALIEIGKDILSLVSKVGTSPEGLAWIGRHMADKIPALKKRIEANKHVPVPKE